MLKPQCSILNIQLKSIVGKHYTISCLLLIFTHQYLAPEKILENTWYHPAGNPFAIYIIVGIDSNRPGSKLAGSPGNIESIKRP